VHVRAFSYSDPNAASGDNFIKQDYVFPVH